MKVKLNLENASMEDLDEITLLSSKGIIEEVFDPIEMEVITATTKVMGRKDKRSGPMSEKHKESIRQAWRDKKKTDKTDNRFSGIMKKYLLKNKKNNVPYKDIARRMNKKFNTEFTKEQLKKKYEWIK